MTRLLIHVEGDTEETFVNEILGPHLYACGYTMVSARLIGNSRQRDRRGGIIPWSAARRDILNHLKEDAGRLVSTMVDYYGLPKSHPKAWPGRETADNVPFQEKANTVENALLTDICEQMGSAFNPNRFIPYLMMHEFEALLFSDCEAFGRGIGRPDIAQEFQKIRDAFGSPEEIDDSPHTAPSKRVERLVPEYQKLTSGRNAVLEMGLDKIRAECPHFRDWLARLERAGQA